MCFPAQSSPSKQPCAPGEQASPLSTAVAPPRAPRALHTGGPTAADTGLAPMSSTWSRGSGTRDSLPSWISQGDWGLSNRK